MSKPAVLGVIGGSGVYHMEGAKIVKEHNITTPFGDPSDAIVEAELDGRTIYFLPRHGRGHVLTPSEVNYRANIYALKQLGVTHAMAVSAVGALSGRGVGDTAWVRCRAVGRRLWAGRCGRAGAPSGTFLPRNVP